jgi:nicotinamide-nucleotide amidase
LQPRAAIVVTGDELLRGFIQDANSGFLARELRRIGIELAWVRFSDDSLESIMRAVGDAQAELGTAGGVVVVTGGLGPTHDDRTTEAVATMCDRALELRDEALAVIEARVRALGRMNTPEEEELFRAGNRKQARFPAGAQVLEPAGTAPGYIVESGGVVHVVLPGPPSELRYAWRQAAATDAFQQVAARVVHLDERLVRTFGIPESHAVAALASTGHEDSDSCRVTLCARDGELEISVRGTDGARVGEVVAGLRRELASHVFAVDDERPARELVGSLVEQVGMTLGVAESCTGGLLGATLTDTAGSSAWFRGGVISYHNDVKRERLGVSQHLLDQHGAVSEPVARAMAAGAREAAGCDIGVAITGIAGPGGGSKDKPVGTVHIAIDSPRGTEHRVVRLPGGREAVRRRSCMLAMHMLLEHLARE